MDALADAPPVLHLLGLGHADGRMHAWAQHGGRVVRVPLEGAFHWEVLPMRSCVGRWDGLRHVPCPTSALVREDATCLACSGLENPACVFEPMCASDPATCACEASFKGVGHVVYLAFYGTLPKVGMTSRRRVEARLREQGADAYLVLQGGMDRATARATEKAVAFLYHVPEHRTHREVLPQLARPVPWEAVEQRAFAWLERLAPRFPVEPTLRRVTDHPVAQPLPGTPRRVRALGTHVGTWLGGKGNHVFYAESAATAALRLPMPQPPIAALPRWDLVGSRVRVLDAHVPVATVAAAPLAP